MGRALALVAVLVLLTGCVPTREVPSASPTDAEMDQFAADIDDWLWEQTALDDSVRPSPIAHRFVSSADWVDRVSQCMTEQGYSAYDVETAGTMMWAFDFADDEAETVAWYECQATYQVDPAESGMTGGAMLDYLYRYNTTVLVPCLEAHGVEVVDVPTREDAGFGGVFEGWNPYYWMRHRFDPNTSPEDRLVFESCPAFPSASYFDDLREIW